MIPILKAVTHPVRPITSKIDSAAETIFRIMLSAPLCSNLKKVRTVLIPSRLYALCQFLRLAFYNSLMVSVTAISRIRLAGA